MDINIAARKKTNSKFYKLQKKEEKKAEKIRRIINENCKYTNFLDNRNSVSGGYIYEDGELNEYDIFEIEKEGLITCGGATRYTIIDENDNEKYILKANYSYEQIWDEDNQEYYSNEFSCDYCEEEISLRNNILSQYPLLAPLFLALYPYKDYYIQEKAKSLVVSEQYEEHQKKDFKNSMGDDNHFHEIVKSIDKSHYDLAIDKSDTDYDILEYVLGYDCGWYYDVYNYYGEKVFKALMKVIDEYNLDDLRDQNIGYSMINNRPVLMDYVGYREN